jgi:hypothetical protein
MTRVLDCQLTVNTHGQRIYRDAIDDLLSMPEQQGHDQGVRKSDFDTIDKTISSALQNSQVIMTGRIIDEVLNGGQQRHESAVS